MIFLKHRGHLVLLPILVCLTLAACPSTNGSTSKIIESAEDKATASQLCSYASMNNLGEIKRLAAEGANFGARGTGDLAPLHIAAEKGLMKVAKLLVENGADVNAKTERQGKYAFSWAMEFGHPDIALYLLENGTEVNGVDDNGASNLAWAISTTNLDICKELIERGADPNILNDRGETPLFWAAHSGYQGIEKMEILINAGVDIHKKNNYGKTALDYILAEDYEGDKVVAKNAEYLRNLMK